MALLERELGPGGDLLEFLHVAGRAREGFEVQCGGRDTMTSETPRAVETELRAWVKEHKVSWELAPQKEMVQGRGMRQTGYALKLFGRIDHRRKDRIDAIAHGAYDRLRALAEEAIRSLPGAPVVLLQPPGRAVVADDTRLVLEAELTILASPPHPDVPLPPAELQRLVALVEGTLRSLGLKKRG